MVKYRPHLVSLVVRSGQLWTWPSPEMSSGFKCILHEQEFPLWEINSVDESVPV